MIIKQIQYVLTSSAKIMLSLPKPIKLSITLLVDIFICLLSSWLALYLELRTPAYIDEIFLEISLLSIVIFLIIFVANGQYQAIFRYSGFADFKISFWSLILYALLFSIFINLLEIKYTLQLTSIIQPLLLFVGFTSSRLIIYFWLTNKNLKNSPKKTLPIVIIYGAGSAGRQVTKTLINENEMKVVGFVDDNRKLHGRRIDRHFIFGPKELHQLIKIKKVTHILLAIPSISRKRRNEIIHNISKHQLIVRTLPSMGEIVKGHVTFNDIRDLNVDDLLTRDVVEPYPDLLRKNIYKKIVLITGAGGSIGSELCRQVVKQEPRTLVLLEINEYSLYSIHQELTELVSLISPTHTMKLIPILSSIQDKDRMLKIFSEWKPNTIYHSAAYKHVPLVEYNIVEAIKNNVFGTVNIAQIAIKNNASDFVMISTDKAVRPTNVMGASKRLAEMCLQALFKEQFKNQKTNQLTKLCMVRFGNVLDSSGSVIPLFRKQILNGRPITLTHPEITRYFMTITEAAQLVIQAGAMVRGGDVFVLDMGKPIKIADLAKNIIKLSGLTVCDKENPDGDVEIVISGLRPGEKLYEELLLGHDPQNTRHPKIKKATDTFISWKKLELKLKLLLTLLIQNNEKKIITLLDKLVDGYKPSAKSKEKALNKNYN